MPLELSNVARYPRSFTRARDKMFASRRIVPDGPVPNEFSDQIRTGNTSIAVNVHGTRVFANVLTTIANLHGHALFHCRVDELTVDILF